MAIEADCGKDTFNLQDVLITGIQLYIKHM